MATIAEHVGWVTHCTYIHTHYLTIGSRDHTHAKQIYQARDDGNGRRQPSRVRTPFVSGQTPR